MAITAHLWSGREARALREARRMSIQDFADHLGVSERMISKWEARGENITPRPANQSALDSTLAASTPEVQARFAEMLDLIPEPRPDQAAATTSEPRESGPDENVIDVLDRINRLNRTIDPEVILQLRGIVHDIVIRYEQLDHSQIVPTLLNQRQLVDSLLVECNRQAQRQQLLEIAGEASGILGYIAVGRSNFPLARAYCLEAFHLGKFAQIPNLQAWARGLQSFGEYYAGEYDEALCLAIDGLEHASSGPQSVRLVINGVARAMGKLGNAEGVHRAVDQAYAFMASNDAPDGFPSSISFECYSAAQTASNAATAYVSLGMPEKVDQYVNLALPEVTKTESPWTRSLIMLDQAASLVSSKDAELERISKLALDALNISAARPIISVRQRATEIVRSATRRWGAAKQISDVRDAIHSGMAPQ